MKYILLSFTFLIAFTANILAQNTLTGKIFDKETKEPLMGVIIAVPNTQIGTTTNSNGVFTLTNGQPFDSVEVRYVGYQTQILKVQGKSLVVALSPSANNMQEIIVTSTRSKVKKDDVPQRVEVLTSEDINNTGAADLTDMLKKNAGVDVIQYPGMLSGIGIRGFTPQFSGINQETLLLINGIPAGATNLATIDLSNIDRIEVIKGPTSSLYGSQAMGGVVNVITKKSIGEIKKTVYASYGSYGTYTAGFAAGGSLDKNFDFDFNMKSVQQTQNTVFGSDNLLRNKFGWTTATLTYYNNKHTVDSTSTLNDARMDGATRDYTKFAYLTGGMRLGYAINDKWRVDLNADFFSGNNVQNPGDIFYGTTQQSTENPYRYGLNLTVTGNIDNNYISLKTYTAIEYSDYQGVVSDTVAPYVTYATTTKWNGFQLQDNIKIKNNIFTVGIDNNSPTAATQSWNAVTGLPQAPPAPNYGIYSTAVFANANLHFLNDRLIATIGGRADYITFDVLTTPYLETSESNKKSYPTFNPSGGVIYKLPKNFNLHASSGRAFVAPTATDVAGYQVAGPGATPGVIGPVNVTEGNPDLKPEQSITVDGGIGYANRRNGLEADFTFFNTVVYNRISTGQTQYVTGTQLTNQGDTIKSITTYENTDKSNMQGMEASFSYNFGALADYRYSLKLYCSIVKYFLLEDKINDPTIAPGYYYTAQIQNVADKTILGGLEYGNELFKTRLSTRYVGRRYDTDWDDFINRPIIEYPPFMLLDFSTSFKVNHSGELTFQVNNITDENYYEKRGFNMAGRNYTVRYAYTF